MENSTAENTSSAKPKKRLVDSYIVIADNVPARISVWNVDQETVPIYQIETPRIGRATAAVLDSMIEELASKVPVEVEEIIDSQKAREHKEKFLHHIETRVKEKLGCTDEEKLVFAGVLLHKMFGLGEIEVLVADNMLEEVAVNGSKEPVSVYHKHYGWCKTNMFIRTETDIYNLSSQIGRKVGNEISSLNPIMDSHLLTGDRVASTLFPISTLGNTITIRRFARNPWTAIHFLDPAINTISKEIVAFLWLAMQYELNIMVAGGTASGKTSMLNSLCTFIPPKQRVISIEDTRELYLPKELHWNWVPLNSRLPNPEGHGAVTMLDLMVASLRMRPDRIVVGEVRRREQAEAMFEAMHTGHSVYATMHADTVQQVKRRLIEPPIAVPKAEIEALHLILIQYRDRRRGKRRTLELAEVLAATTEDLEVNYLYRWQPRTDAFMKVKDSIRVYDDLNLHTGMTPGEINEDLKEKQKVLTWMLKNNIKDINKFGNVMRYYYKEYDILMDVVNKNLTPERILG
ncbi:type II/IV secretion system ATPase subunit [Candidatus Woesearchaeota archaeon]|nr:type II/IV secretion system ATPase subunit [Candidatus Woesearchaeota archaeon]